MLGVKKGPRVFIREEEANNHKEDIKQIGLLRYPVVDGLRERQRREKEIFFPGCTEKQVFVSQGLNQSETKGMPTQTT